MSNLLTRLKRVEENLSKKTASSDLNMGVEFYSCSLGPYCPLRKYQTSEIFAPEGVAIENQQCKHRFVDNLPNELKKKYGILE